MECAELHRSAEQGSGVELCLLDFTVSTTFPKPLTAQVNDELEVEGVPIIQFRLVGKDFEIMPIKINLIRGGKVIEEFSGHTPIEILYTDVGFIGHEKSYYRLVATSKESRITSLPIFVRRGTGSQKIEMNQETLSDLPCHVFSYSGQ